MLTYIQNMEPLEYDNFRSGRSTRKKPKKKNHNLYTLLYYAPPPFSTVTTSQYMIFLSLHILRACQICSQKEVYDRHMPTYTITPGPLINRDFERACLVL